MPSRAGGGFVFPFYYGLSPWVSIFPAGRVCSRFTGFGPSGVGVGLALWRGAGEDDDEG